MNASAPSSTPSLRKLDPDLLDRMIGAKGETETIEQKCQTLLALLCPALAGSLNKSIGIAVDARPGDIKLGRRRVLLADLSRDAAYCEATISGWSPDIGILCGTKLVIGLVECLLGGSDPDQLDIVARPLSGIELDMSLVVFEQLNDTLRDVVSADPQSKASASRPRADIPDEEDDPTPNFHAAALTLNLEFGAISAPLTLVLPQALLLKSKLTAVKPNSKSGAEPGNWTERLSERVSRSQISLQAAVALAPMPLGDISRLQPGDLIGFADNGDISVTLSANGKPLYTCALGRSGSRYMVKIEGQAGPDENWKSDFS
ncbi:FliM/FliN family flagellar motor switch protein [Hoeflea sp. G2-23]|uniref:Flagellar motor switch protein FliM n=1 Tax=Hoeflea algicola TaxID=2983763 RepID=A0ABT3ZF40_9HYPH|nr:FliM/FliN family flagellar motor switch protein [Hoeflea algicola]MCY0149914.1 FliM/FliN family flagellar motor switch protein [Hoeflea algicola]